VIGALTVALTYGIAKRAVDPAGAWLAAGASALYPLFIYSSGAFFPVTLQVALVASAVYLVLVALERGSNVAAMGAGACSGWAILTTGSALPAMLLVAPWMMWSATKRKGALPGASQESGAGGSSGHGTATRPAGGSWARGARLALVYLIPIVVIVGAWTCRNQMRFGHPVMISTNGGYNLWLGNYPGATASTGNRYDQPGMEAEAAKVWYGLEDEVPRDHAFYRLAVGHIRADIPHFIRLSLSKALELWALYAQPVTQDRPRLGFEKLASILSYGVLLPLALIWLVRAIPRSPLAVLVLGFFIAYTAFHAVILAKVRFRLPVDSFVIIYGCGAAGALLRRLRRR
jgi:hypothetical protein